jgi:ribosomal protein S18 acetylase RimI-like enzyme
VSDAVSIRAATISDIDGILRLWESEGVPRSSTDNSEAVRLLVEHPTSSLLVAHDGEAVVGSLVVGWDGWRGELYRLAVAPTHRRRGVARELVRRGERLLLELGAQRLNVLVLRDDTVARSFWTSVGYILDDRTSRYVRG